MPGEEERSLGARNSYGESSILLLAELKELALWDQDCVMDDDDVGYMVSVMSKFRELAFVSEMISTKKKKKKKSYGKQKESQVECEANLDSILADENAHIEEDIPSTEPRSNAHPEVSSLGNQSVKGLGSLIHCHSSVERLKSISKARKRLFVDSDEPLLKKPKHSVG